MILIATVEPDSLAKWGRALKGNGTVVSPSGPDEICDTLPAGLEAYLEHTSRKLAWILGCANVVNRSKNKSSLPDNRQPVTNWSFLFQTSADNRPARQVRMASSLGMRQRNASRATPSFGHRPLSRSSTTLTVRLPALPTSSRRNTHTRNVAISIFI